MSQADVNVDDTGGTGKVFLILGLLAGVALGGGLSYYYFSTQAPDKEGTEHVDKAPKGPVHSIAFERLAVPIYMKSESKSRFIGNYFIDLAVQVRGDENQIQVKRSQPQLQHAFLSAISQTNLMRDDEPLQLDHDKVARALKAKANEVLGAGIVENVSIINTMRLSR